MVWLINELSSYDAAIYVSTFSFVEIDERQNEISTDLSRMIERFVVYQAFGNAEELEILIITA